MKNNKPLSKLNQGVLLVLIFAVLLASFAGIAGVVYARYTNSQHAQRVIAPYDMGGARFSSNYLIGGFSKDNVKVLYVTDETVRPSTGITVCNYQRDNQLRFNESNVTYDVTFRLVSYNSVTGEYGALTNADLSAASLTAYSVDVKKVGDDTTYTLAYDSGHPSENVEIVYEACSLTGGSAQAHSYTVKFSAANGLDTSACFALNNPNLCVEIEAEATDGSLPILRGIFRVGGIKSEGATNAWDGRFADSTVHAPNDYDGFNYTVSGTGSGTFTLKWDATKVTLRDDSILELLAITGAIRNGNCITFPVDSDTTPRYDLYFSKVNVEGVVWGNMNSELNSAQEALASGKAVGFHFGE